MELTPCWKSLGVDQNETIKTRALRRRNRLSPLPENPAMCLPYPIGNVTASILTPDAGILPRLGAAALPAVPRAGDARHSVLTARGGKGGASTRAGLPAI